ncbi:MAG: FeS assembly ATPase SufC [Parcubacteria group bacterium GW2011_GWA2_43_13]|nr:MAG: FeS assembly ATPase SufC [Parcubacteria group bacterium GW2011_GWA2_43_13]OGY68565.1 MAG: Fe-S cluster assembly ATPase SufC [Candidatus Jacksonbacteria bacterium RIFCSPHIGHO2_02_FULL_43_10]OGY70561.1 MAG: Fe-S cluster assembly ATPase SufC [Candidatus Jacksonbacteria bacterium RIFCSPLOWO2_01_FULL_44_13]HAZ16337.1 Fe-S cluster assembly ATPase SufC [Candidatus Jacksonbacteria bacterium]
MSMVFVRGLDVCVEQKVIIHNLSLEIRAGEIHAIMGPNGSGKSTLAQVIAGNPGFEVTHGEILFEGKSIVTFSPEERARKGVFLAFQYPVEIPGVSLSSFLRTAYQRTHAEVGSVAEFQKEITSAMQPLGIAEEFSDRNVNEGFSGGEKKKAEILQLKMLDPKFAVIDEIDSGLDIDALQAVAQSINEWMSPEKSVLIITHYNRILKYLTPTHVHIMKQGRIMESGGKELAEQVEAMGYRESQ